MTKARTALSVIIPVYNESENLRLLYDWLTQSLQELARSYQIVFCDDGSQDGSSQLLEAIAAEDPRVTVVLLRRNFGQTAAITAGIDHAVGDIIVLMDADLQNDPGDITKLLAKIEEGYDVVSGWRRDRNDPFWTKVLPSRFANGLISWLTGVKLHDHGCTLKAYRREIINEFSLYGEMHRFIPLYGHWQGAQVAEVEVRHHPRKHGRSKYSIAKTFKVLLDLPVLVLLGSYLTRPVHFFGGIGLFSWLVGIFCITMVAWEKITEPAAKAHRNPFLLLGVFFFLAGLQILMIGLLAEMMTRVYHESLDKKTYTVRNVINQAEDPPSGQAYD